MHKTTNALLPPLLLVLAACASGPRLEVSSTGILPVDAAPGFVVGDVEGRPSLEAETAAAVGKALVARGWAPGGETPHWRIEVAYSERPSTVGGFLEEAAPEDPALWRAPPSPRRWWRRTEERRALTLRILENANGREVVRATASERAAAEPLPVTLDRLAAAAVAKALAADTGENASTVEAR